MTRTTKQRKKVPTDYPHVAFRPTDQQLRWINSASKARGVSRSTIIRDALNAYLKVAA